MKSYDLIIIGAGIAGMTAAISAINCGIRNILMVDRENYIGGMMNQCIHNAFGKELLGKELTGPEYIEYLRQSLQNNHIEILTKTTVLDINENKIVTYVNSISGVQDVKGLGIIFAMGAKEKYVGDIMLVTKNLIGIQTLGEAHRIINFEGYLPGSNSIIFAKNKWAFIVARRMLIEGGKVKAIIMEKKYDEIIDEEIEDIIEGFNMNILDYTKIVGVDGKGKIEKVTIQNLRDKKNMDLQCDSLILSVDFESEDYLAKKINANIKKDNNDYETTLEGFFACGNIIYGEKALKMKGINGDKCGKQAAQYIKSQYFN